MADRTDLFWSFLSPYSYIALRRLVAPAERFGARLDLRVVHPATRTLAEPAARARLDLAELTAAVARWPAIPTKR